MKYVDGFVLDTNNALKKKKALCCMFLTDTYSTCVLVIKTTTLTHHTLEVIQNEINFMNIKFQFRQVDDR